MAPTLASSVLDAVLGLQLGPIEEDAGNRLSAEGVTFGARHDGAVEFRIRKLEAASLRLGAGPLVLEVGRLAVSGLIGRMRTEGSPRLCAVEAAEAELSGVKVRGPLTFPSGSAAGASWCLGPLAAADGTIRAKIVDAHLLFDADVTVPVRQGRIDFNEATVEHAGPDSRMGVSRLGLYVDAPNGRSYLYQFPSAPVAGVAYERRGALPGPWVSDRGRLDLQAFGEELMRQLGGGQALGVTEQARLLLDRTTLSGEMQLGDGRFAAPRVRADVVGRGHGSNAVRLHSQAAGRGLTVEMTALSVRQAVFDAGDAQLACDRVAGTLTLQLSVDAGRLRFASDFGTLKMSGLSLQPKE